VLDAGRAIQRHSAGKTRDAYLADEVLRGFVERKLLIVGEALARLRQHHAAAAEKITDIHRIIGQRNRIVHGYDAVDGGRFADLGCRPKSSTQPARRSGTIAEGGD
jgi:uncharacterized protein with HEPN domain